MSDSRFIQNNLNIKKLSIGDIDIDPSYIISLNIYESIDIPGITGTIYIKDYGAIKEKNEIFSGDLLKISFKSDFRNEINSEFIIYESLPTYIEEESNFFIIGFNFCSKFLYNLTIQKCNKVFKGKKKIHDILEEILKDCKANIGYIEETIQEFNNFCPPFWNYLFILKYLLNLSSNSSKKAGFICFENLFDNNVKIYSLDSILNGSIGLYPEEIVIKTVNDSSHDKLYNLTLENDFNIFKYILKGYHKTNVYSINYDYSDSEQSYFISSIFSNIDNQFTTKENCIEYPYTHLSKYIPINKEFFENEELIKKTRNIIFEGFFLNQDEKIENKEIHENFINALAQNHYIYKCINFLKANILVNGDSNKSSGMLVRLKFPSLEEDRTSGDNHYSGTWLITSINHILSPSKYYQAITLSSDGYKIFNPKKVKSW